MISRIVRRVLTGRDSRRCPIQRGTWWPQWTIKEGDTVVAFEARGCMAEDHVFKWFGHVWDFGVQERGDRLRMASIRVLKRGNRDYRDWEEEQGCPTMNASASTTGPCSS